MWSGESQSDRKMLGVGTALQRLQESDHPELRGDFRAAAA